MLYRIASKSVFPFCIGIVHIGHFLKTRCDISIIDIPTKKSRPNFRENVGKMNLTFFVDLELRDSPHIKKRIEKRKNNEKLKYTYMK